MKAVLFDIDGTLVRMGGAGRAALVRAAALTTGCPFERAREVLERIDFRGSTDASILGQIARGLGLDEADGVQEKIVRSYVELLPDSIAACRCEILPGVRRLLESLEARSGSVVVGLLTGNIREGARIKLDTFGLSHLVERPGGFGEDGPDRVAVASAAVGRLAAAGVRPERTLVVGDTEHDVRAARAVGASAVAVATGWTEVRELRAAGPDLLLADLADPSQLLEALDGLT